MSILTATAKPILLAADAGDAAGQWVHLLPVGLFAARDGRPPWRLDDPAEMIAATRAYAGATDIVVDYEHQSDQAAKDGGKAPAAGWIKKLEARANGVWGLVEWTAIAAAHIRTREYRYLSPVFSFSAQDGRVMRLLRAGLTNTPALQLTALAKSETTMDDNKQPDAWAELRLLLELDESAEPSAIVAGVKSLLEASASALPDPSAFVPIEALRDATAEVNRLNRGVAGKAAEDAVMTAVERGRLPPFLKGWAIGLCKTNKPAFDEFVDQTAPGFSALFKEIVPGIPPDHHGRSTLDPEQEAVCAALGHTPDEFIARGKAAEKEA